MKTAVVEARVRNTSPKFYSTEYVCRTLVAFVLEMKVDGLSG